MIFRKHGISPSTYQTWKDQFLTGARSGLEGKSRKSPYKKQVEDLKATIADLAIANDALKEGSCDISVDIRIKSQITAVGI